MILFLQPIDSKERQWYKITDLEDLNPVFSSFPMTQEIAMSCDTLKEAVQAISEYLSGHSMSSWVEENDISKSLRSKAIAIGLSLSTALAPDVRVPTPSVQPTMQQSQKKDVPATPDFGTHPMDRFLWNVQQIESSGGKNVQHKPISSGKFRGTKAIGKWGMLKPTVDDMIGRMRVKGTLTPEYQNLEQMSRDGIEEKFKANPQMELDIARQLAQHVMARQKNDPYRAAYSWLHGHNLHPADIPKDKLVHSEYVGKYKQVDKLNPFRKRASSAVKKSMPQIDSSDFSMRVKNWFKRREEELTENPTRSSNFMPDTGRKRDADLDDIKPNSMKDPMQILQDNVKWANKDRQ